VIFLIFAACGGGPSLTLDQALDRIDVVGAAEEPLTLEALSESLGMELSPGMNHPGSPFEQVRVLKARSGGPEVEFYFEPGPCFTEAAARERYGHLFANISGHLEWNRREWVAQPEGYRLSIGLDQAGCVRRLGLTDAVRAK